MTLVRALTHPVHSSHCVLVPQPHPSLLSHRYSSSQLVSQLPIHKDVRTRYEGACHRLSVRMQDTFLSLKPTCSSPSLTFCAGDRGTKAYCAAARAVNYSERASHKMEKCSEPVSSDTSSPPGKHSQDVSRAPLAQSMKREAADPEVTCAFQF